MSKTVKLWCTAAETGRATVHEVEAFVASLLLKNEHWHDKEPKKDEPPEPAPAEAPLAPVEQTTPPPPTNP